MLLDSSRFQNVTLWHRLVGGWRRVHNDAGTRRKALPTNKTETGEHSSTLPSNLTCRRTRRQRQPGTASSARPGTPGFGAALGQCHRCGHSGCRVRTPSRPPLPLPGPARERGGEGARARARPAAAALPTPLSPPAVRPRCHCPFLAPAPPRHSPPFV